MDFAGLVYTSLRPRYQHNPFNITKGSGAKWQGLVGYYDHPSNGLSYCLFDSPYYGVRAYFKLLSNYLKMGVVKLGDIIGRFCPGDSNYLPFVSSVTGWPSDKVVSRTDLPLLGEAMSRLEGYPVALSFLQFVFDKMVSDNEF